MNEIKNQNIPFYSISTVFRSEQIFFKCKWVSKQLNSVTHFFVQDKTSAELLTSIGIKNHTISGDTRFETVKSNSKKINTFPLIKKFTESKETIVFGSTWPKDEKIIIEYIKNNRDKNYIIAPHELKNIQGLRTKIDSQLYSKLTKKNLNISNTLIIDNIGMLSKIYTYADYAYIGGGFNNGIHNILEAAVFGLPIIFGPKHQKFKEASELIRLGGAKTITKYIQLSDAIKSFENYDKSISKKYILDHCGSIKIIMQTI